MNILNNFVNPWESGGVFGSQALGTEVLEGNVLEENVLEENVLEEDTNSLNPYRAYCFDENGKLVARFKFEVPSGGVFVVLRSDVNAFPSKVSESKNDRTKRYFAYLKNKCLRTSLFYKDFGKIDSNGKIQFPASSISKIYTQILKDFNFDITKLHNDKLSVYGGQTYQYNDAIPEKALFGTTYKNLNPPAKFKITIGTMRLDEIDTVGSSVSSLGAHEYEGHGINGWKDDDETHYRVYEHQKGHSSWSFLTTNEKDNFLRRYVEYIIDELPKQPELFWEKIRAVEKDYGEKKEYVQTNAKLHELYEQVGGK